MDTGVELIKELVDNVKSKQLLDQSLTEIEIQKHLKQQNKRSKRHSPEKISKTHRENNDTKLEANVDQANQRQRKPTHKLRDINAEPLQVTKKIAKNKKTYHAKLQQFDDYIKQREIQQQKENERIQIELQKMQKEKEEQEKQLQDLMNSSLTERNAWFHRYSKSNLGQRKQRILNIHQENQKIVKRLLEIKPHPDMILLSKQTLPIDLKEIQPSQQQTILNNTRMNQTQRDFVGENNSSQGQDILSKFTRLTPSNIPQEYKQKKHNKLLWFWNNNLRSWFKTDNYYYGKCCNLLKTKIFTFDLQQQSY
eukprot:403354612